MVYVRVWEEFMREAEALWLRDPLRTRVVTKYRHKEGRLVIKVTNSRKCFKFATEQQSDLNKMARMNTLMLGLCARGVKESERLREEEEQAASTSSASQAAGGGGGSGAARDKNARKKRGPRRT